MTKKQSRLQYRLVWFSLATKETGHGIWRDTLSEAYDDDENFFDVREDVRHTRIETRPISENITEEKLAHER